MSRSDRSHERLEDLIVADALDALEEADRLDLQNQLAEHGEDCAECLDLLSSYSEVAARLAGSLDPVPLSPGAEDRLLEAARATGVQGLRTVPAVPAPSRRPEGLRQSRRGGSRWPAVLGAAAVIAILAGAFGYLIAPRGLDVEVLAFPAVDGQQLAVAHVVDGDRGWVIGSGLERPTAGQVFELWYQVPGSQTMQPAGIFLPEDGTVFAEVSLAESFDLLAVTVERRLEQQPTTEPIFVAEATEG